MNNQETKTEYTIEQILKSFQDVQPGEELFRKTLQKIPDNSFVVSPFFIFRFKNYIYAAILIFVLVGGGIIYSTKTINNTVAQNQNQMLTSDTSDFALDKDVSNLDAQMNALTTDNQNIDQSFSS